MRAVKAKQLRKLARASYDPNQVAEFRKLYKRKQLRKLLDRFTRKDFRNFKHQYSTTPRPYRVRFVDLLTSVISQTNGKQQSLETNA